MDNLLWKSLKQTEILRRIYRKPFLNDEPKLISFGVELNLNEIQTDGNLPDLFGSGTSIDADCALSKAIFECVERFSLSEFKFKNLAFDSYKNIRKTNLAVNPNNFCYFTDKQLKDYKYRDFCFSSECKFYWTECKNVVTNQKIYLPAQAVYCPYKYQSNEKMINFPITTGASVSENIDEAIYKGLCEVIERDTYMINYLLKLEPKEIDYDDLKSNEIKDLVEIFEKYRLEIKSYILVSDLEIPTVLSVIIDKSNYGPALSIGLKTEWNLKNAVVGSIEEAFQVRSWIRIVMIKNEWQGDTYTSKNMLKRAYLWKDAKNLNKLDFIFKSSYKSKKINVYLNKRVKNTSKQKLEMLKKILRKNKIEAYYKDITSKKFKNMPVTVVKCVMPNLHPMFIDQDFPYLGGQRIEYLMKKHKTKVLNLYPHPFL
jgi:ribosomal protein S12 methylthiotransferase accessory factor